MFASFLHKFAYNWLHIMWARDGEIFIFIFFWVGVSERNYWVVWTIKNTTKLLDGIVLYRKLCNKAFFFFSMFKWKYINFEFLWCEESVKKQKRIVSRSWNLELCNRSTWVCHIFFLLLLLEVNGMRFF